MCDDGMTWGEGVAYIEVPRAMAKNISDLCDKDQVIITCWDAGWNRTHVTTYGRGFINSEQAAIGGNRVKKALNWPDSLCHAEPERVVILKQALKRFKAVVNSLDCQCDEDYVCTTHSDLALADEAIRAML
jgi:hypothetical protein